MALNPLAKMVDDLTSAVRDVRPAHNELEVLVVEHTFDVNHVRHSEDVVAVERRVQRRC